MWIAQISDSHLCPRDTLYKGVVDSNRALAAAVDQLNRLSPQPDVVLLTGDVAETGDPAEYAMAQAILGGLKARLLPIPGNHDDRAAFRAAFLGRACLPGEGPLHYMDECGPVRILALDVTVPGAHHGHVDDVALAWLELVLASEPDRPTVIMLHQPPLVSGVPYLDAYRCFGAARLEAVIARYPRVERVLCGHVHRQMQMRFGGTLLITAPSTASAIALRVETEAEAASFLEPSGFLLHHWRANGGMLTHYVPVGEFAGPFPFA